MRDQITIALAKGRLAEQAISLLESIGVDVSQVKQPGRRLVMESEDGTFRFILVKPSDVPTYVEHGVADIGVVGKDTLMEENRPLYELLDLGFGACRLCVCGFANHLSQSIAGAHYRVATKYPRIARSYFDALGENIEIIPLNGSVELGPLVGLSDVIVDIVESGGTLRANGLEVLETIAQVSARVVVNVVSLKTQTARIRALIDGLAQEKKRRETEALA